MGMGAFYGAGLLCVHWTVRVITTINVEGVPVRASEYSWYITFWVGMGVVTLAPIYALLYLILRAVVSK